MHWSYRGLSIMLSFVASSAYCEMVAPYTALDHPEANHNVYPKKHLSSLLQNLDRGWPIRAMIRSRILLQPCKHSFGGCNGIGNVLIAVRDGNKASFKG